MTILWNIAFRMFNCPLLFQPEKAAVIVSVLRERLPIGDVSELRRAAEANIYAMPTAAQAVMRGPFPGASRFIGEAVEDDPQTGKKRYLPLSAYG